MDKAENKRIARNTLILYVRLAVATGISLYTSRIILQTLGVVDYGIYGVVGGIVTLFTFLNSSMAGATSRFLTFELGRGNSVRLHETFVSALILHVIIALVIALAAESYLIDARNIIINGYTGVGKTYLSCAIAKEACRRLHKTRYVRMPKMLEEFNLSTQTGSGISKLVKRYSTYHLLIVDEWLVEIPSEMEVKYLLEIFEIRYDLHPTIFCTQYKQSE